MTKISRRAFMIAMPVVLSACVARQPVPQTSDAQVWPVPDYIRDMYAAVNDEPYPLPMVDVSRINPKYWRQIVNYTTTYPPGTLIVDTQNFFLYLVMENGQAIRYGVGVGRAGLALQGEAIVQNKREWPSWAPTKAMMERDPEIYGHLGGGMKPGPDNPLGARALYLYRDGKDTYFRIHGSPEAWSIGKAMSSGCIRLLNQDIIDLYRRVTVGSRVVILQNYQPETFDTAEI